MSFQTLQQFARTAQADIKLARQSLKSADLSSMTVEQQLVLIRSELCENTYPILESLARHGFGLAKELEELDGVVGEMVDQEESFLTPGDAETVFTALGGGAALVEELTKLLPTIEDDLQKKRIVDGIKAYQRAAEIAAQTAADAAANSEEEEEEEEGDDEAPDAADDGGDDGEDADTEDQETEEGVTNV